MVRLVLRLSRPAKIAVLVAALGACLAIYGRAQGVAWATVTGSLALFGGAIVYYFERFRSFRKRD